MNDSLSGAYVGGNSSEAWISSDLDCSDLGIENDVLGGSN